MSLPGPKWFCTDCDAETEVFALIALNGVRCQACGGGRLIDLADRSEALDELALVKTPDREG